jgi:catechol 2,3-dioxygenase-like lactoylglutathione lyase family enzyme
VHVVAFPSVEWFEALGERVVKDKEKFRRLGYFDADVGIKVDANGARSRGYVIAFEDYGVKGVRAVADPVKSADFTIEGGLDAWSEMVRNIREHGGPDLDHTLNRLTMAGVPLKVVAGDQLKTDIFYRFNQSIQAFFNEAASVPTEFETK